MPVDTEVWAEVVGDVVRELDVLLSQVSASGWKSPAVSVGWSCWRAAEHITAVGFAAVGAAEGLVHGHDIAAGLNIPWMPEPPLCERVLSVVFPGAALGAPASAFETLLIRTGRAERPPHEPAPSWSYAAAAALPLSGKP